MVAPRALVFRPLVRVNEVLGTRLPTTAFWNKDRIEKKLEFKSVYVVSKFTCVVNMTTENCA